MKERRAPARARFALLVGAVAAAAAVVRHRHGGTSGRPVAGGVLVGDAGAYDRLTRLIFGSFYRGVAADIAAAAEDGAQVLDVGCGPGHLALVLARRHGLDVTGVDLDPAMIERARANAARTRDGRTHPPTFHVGDAAALDLPDASMDLVVSTLAMHHWADPSTALTEIGRVLRPTGRALVWDLRTGAAPFHSHAPPPVEDMQGTGLRVVSAVPWRWPLRLAPTQRIEYVPAAG